MRNAIIDIGSNAIRMIVYDRQSIGAIRIFEEKFKISVRELLDSKNFNIKHEFYTILEYFLRINDTLGVKKIIAVGTAVFRSHTKSNEWVSFIQKKYDLKIEILSGEREAYLSAYGVLQAIPDPKGLIADLGGGSIELAQIQNKQIGNLVSLELGTKILQRRQLSFLEITNIFKDKASNLLEPYDNLYLTGGSFRVIARHYIKYCNYPIKNIHNFLLESKYLMRHLYNINSFSKSNNRFLNVDKFTVVLLQALINFFSPGFITTSTYGLKEGIFFDQLPEKEKQKNIVIELTKNATNFPYDDSLLLSYRELISNLLINKDQETLEVIDLSLIIVTTIQNVDPSLINYFINTLILTSATPFTHRQRVMLSIAASYVFHYKLIPNMYKLSKMIISKSDYHNSFIIGKLVKIYKIMDINDIPKNKVELCFKSNKIILSEPYSLPHSMISQINKDIYDVSNTINNKILEKKVE